MNRALSFRDVQAVLEKVPELRDIVLVGGQALNHWADHYRIVEYGIALSFDIDFLGGGDAAYAFARGTGGRAAIAAQSDAHSPNTALVTVTIDGEEHHVDFLGSLYGFSVAELQRVKDWAVRVQPDGGGPPLAVMHPVHCLESVLANTYGSALDRRSGPRGERAAERVRLGVEACRRMALDYLNAARDRDALRLAEKVHALSISEPALRAGYQDGIDVSLAIPVEQMPEKFAVRRWPQMSRARQQAVERYRRLLARRAALAKRKR